MGRSSAMETIGWLASIMMMLRRSDDWRRETSGKGRHSPTGKNETVGKTARSRAQHLGKLGLLRNPGDADVTKIKHIQTGERVLGGGRKERGYVEDSNGVAIDNPIGLECLGRNQKAVFIEKGNIVVYV